MKQRLLCDDLWQEIRARGKSCRRRMAAVAYVTTDHHMRFGQGDVLVCDASDGAVRSGETSARLLRRLVAGGVEVYSLANLHAKVIVLDSIAIIGSANLSASSAGRLLEAALLTDHATTVASARAMICDLSRLPATQKVDGDFLKRISALKVSPRRFVHTGRRQPPFIPREPRIWLVSVHDLDDDAFPEEAAARERGQKKAECRRGPVVGEVSWIRHTGGSLFRRTAREEDRIIVIDHGNGRGSPTVRPPVPLIYRQEEPRCTRFYTEEPPDVEERVLAWRQFMKMSRLAGLPGRIGPSSCRLLTARQAEALDQHWP